MGGQQQAALCRTMHCARQIVSGSMCVQRAPAQPLAAGEPPLPAAGANSAAQALGTSVCPVPKPKVPPPASWPPGHSLPHNKQTLALLALVSAHLQIGELLRGAAEGHAPVPAPPRPPPSAHSMLFQAACWHSGRAGERACACARRHPGLTMEAPKKDRDLRPALGPAPCSQAQGARILPSSSTGRAL